jgi:hypothetical protein
MVQQSEFVFVCATLSILSPPRPYSSEDPNDRTQPGLVVFLLGPVARNLEGAEEKSVRAIGNGSPVSERRGIHSHDVDAIAVG